MISTFTYFHLLLPLLFVILPNAFFQCEKHLFLYYNFYMDIKDFRVYMNYVAEISRLQCRIDTLTKELAALEASGVYVADTVSCGYKGRKSLGTVKIGGFPEEEHTKKKTQLLAARLRSETLLVQVQAQAAAVSEYLDGIENIEVRQILYYRYLMPGAPLSWLQVANKMNKLYKGPVFSADNCRMIVNRYLRAHK